jgi:hypothetical protein
MTTIAYCYETSDLDGELGWMHFCPACEAAFRSGVGATWPEADAEMLDLNGDTLNCYDCGKEIR